jgi:hypothetical protein
LPVFLSHNALNKFLNQDLVICGMQERILHGSGYSTIKGDGNEANHYAKAILPISSDKGVLLFHNWFHRFSGGRIPFRGSTDYLSLEKDTVFDVYNTHTKYCTECSGTLENLCKIRVASSLTTVALVIWNPSPFLEP